MLRLPLLVLMLTPSISNLEGEQALNSQPSCKPFRLLVIWETSSGDDTSFFQQRRLIIDLINKTEGTEILLTTVGTTVKYLDINKTSANNSWIGKIGSHKPENLRNYIIPYSSISKAVFKFLNQAGSQKMAEVVFFVVNEKTDIANVGKVKEVLKYKKVFVVFVGMSPPPDVWTSVATNRQHLFVLSDTSQEKVRPAAEEIFRLCCQDAELKCDNDEYWTGKICYKCSYLCSADTNNPSEKCLEECPYFASSQCAEGAEAKHETCDHMTLNTVLTLLITCFLLFLFLPLKYLKKKCQFVKDAGSYLMKCWKETPDGKRIEGIQKGSDEEDVNSPTLPMKTLHEEGSTDSE